MARKKQKNHDTVEEKSYIYERFLGFNQEKQLIILQWQGYHTDWQQKITEEPIQHFPDVVALLELLSMVDSSFGFQSAPEARNVLSTTKKLSAPLPTHVCLPFCPLTDHFQDQHDLNPTKREIHQILVDYLQSFSTSIVHHLWILDASHLRSSRFFIKQLDLKMKILVTEYDDQVYQHQKQMVQEYKLTDEVHLENCSVNEWMLQNSTPHTHTEPCVEYSLIWWDYCKTFETFAKADLLHLFHNHTDWFSSTNGTVFAITICRRSGQSETASVVEILNFLQNLIDQNKKLSASFPIVKSYHPSMMVIITLVTRHK